MRSYINSEWEEESFFQSHKIGRSIGEFFSSSKDLIFVSSTICTYRAATEVVPPKSAIAVSSTN